MNKSSPQNILPSCSYTNLRTPALPSQYSIPSRSLRSLYLPTNTTYFVMEENEHPVWAELRDMQAHDRVRVIIPRRSIGPELTWDACVDSNLKSWEEADRHNTISSTEKPAYRMLSSPSDACQKPFRCQRQQSSRNRGRVSSVRYLVVYITYWAQWSKRKNTLFQILIILEQALHLDVELSSVVDRRSRQRTTPFLSAESLSGTPKHTVIVQRIQNPTL